MSGANTRKVLKALLLLAVVTVPWMVIASCCHTCPPQAVVEPEYNPADVETATTLVTKSPVLTNEVLSQLKAIYFRLPGTQRFEVSRQLAAAINSKTIKIPEDVFPVLGSGQGTIGAACPQACKPPYPPNREAPSPSQPK
jgi:hypothetical protein